MSATVSRPWPGAAKPGLIDQRLTGPEFLRQSLRLRLIAPSVICFSPYFLLECKGALQFIRVQLIDTAGIFVHILSRPNL